MPKAAAECNSIAKLSSATGSPPLDLVLPAIEKHPGRRHLSTGHAP
jgi:hypothetical protein